VTTELYHLQSAAHPMIDNRFLAGDRELTKDDLRPYLQPLGRSIDLSPVDERIEEIRADDDIDAQDSLIDAELAPTLHRTLDLTRNEAADAWAVALPLCRPIPGVRSLPVGSRFRSGESEQHGGEIPKSRYGRLL